MDIQPYKVEKVRGGKVEYRKIQAWQARNYDGDPANFKPCTPDGDRWLVEKRFIPKNGHPRFTNYW
jgi:hypothetical protein